MSSVPETIAALATPAGTSAIALVRASGPHAGELGRQIFGVVPPPRVVRHADYRDAAGQLVDDVLFLFFAGPSSYTGEDTLEISCHGNPYIAQRILEDLVQRGCKLAEAGEFTKRAFLNGRVDLTQAEAVMDLIQARSERALAAANQQLRGSLGRATNDLISGLVGLLAQLEAYIDFPEEDLPPENRAEILRALGELQAGTERILATGRYGELLRDGLRTVIVGEPNVGKSSLLNRLVGRERALVSPEPGTTRDYLEEVIRVGPHLLRLIDTAGLNSAPSSLERRGIEKTFEMAKDAHLFLWVVEATQTLPGRSPRLAEFLKPENTLVVVNKSDLAPEVVVVPHGYKAVRISALTGCGIGELTEAIGGFADSFPGSVDEDLVAINARHAVALGQTKESLALARRNLLENNALELIASDLRQALDFLGSIAGRIDNEKVLDRLFSTFCIGK